MDTFYNNGKKCSDKNKNRKIPKSTGSTKYLSTTGNSGATDMPPIGDGLKYNETSANFYGPNVYCSFGGTDIFQISNIGFYYNCFSARRSDSFGRFMIQALLSEKSWSTRYDISKNDRFSKSSTAWTLVSVIFTVENEAKKLTYDEVDTPLADMCFSNITISHCVY